MLHVQCFPDPWPAKAFTTLLETGAHGFVVMGKSSLDGVILLRAAADEAEILTFAVNPLRRRQGIGAGLLIRSLAFLETMNIKTLLLEVAQNNHAAKSLYRKIGFQEVGNRAGYYHCEEGTIDAVIMKKVVFL